MTPEGKRPMGPALREVKLWIMRIPVVSTAHVRQDTLDKLALAQEFRVIDYYEGAFVWVGMQAYSNAPEEMKPLVEWFSNAFPKEWWIRLDRDGDLIPGLPVYEW